MYSSIYDCTEAKDGKSRNKANQGKTIFIVYKEIVVVGKVKYSRLVLAKVFLQNELPEVTLVASLEFY